MRIVYLDISDQSVSPHFDILSFVDLYLIHTVFRNPENYFREFRGANQFADYLSRRFGIEPTEANQYYPDHFGSTPAKDQMHKIALSWNRLFRRKDVKAFQRQGFKCVSHGSARDIDVNYRFNPYSGWCKFHRTLAAEKLDALSPEFRVVSSIGKVPYKTYLQELEHSKIVFSPFGWGEFCPKDYEAVMNGALLVKPSMEEIELSPAFYRPFETYVPVQWDLSDLEDKVRHYIANVQERERIVGNAAAELEKIFAEKQFLTVIDSILKRL